MAESLPALPVDLAEVGARAANFARASKSPATRRAAHRMAGLGFEACHPAITSVLGGIRRTLGTAPQAKTAILTEDLRRMVRALPKSIWNVRGGFAGWAHYRI
jgi:hypothetical protein